MANAQQTGNFIITLLLVIISIASIVGLYWLSTIVFTAHSSDGNKTYTITNFSKTRMRLAQLTVVLFWFQICLTFVGALWTVSHYNN